MNKKALSPLIATVLLIAFAVALGAVVMNLARPTGGGGGPPTTIAKAVDCADVKFVVQKIGASPQICLSKTAANTLQFIVDNKGGIKLKAIKITIVGANGDPINQDVPNSAIGEAEVKKLAFTYPAEIGDIALVKVTPVVADFVNGKDLFCTDKTVEVSDIKSC